jgi:metal-sulfur cluster biosynthetic enzyme
VVRRRVGSLEGVDTTEVSVVWEPQWTPQLISPDGRKILGIEEEGGGEE